MLRLGLAVACVAALLTGEVPPGPDPRAPYVAVAAYGAASLLVEGARRLWQRIGRGGSWLLTVGLLLDGVWIGAECGLTRGITSYLVALFSVHAVAVTLVASYRTGLTIALWHSLVLQLVTTLSPTVTGSVVQAGRTEVAVLSGLWGLVVTTAAASAVNERDLRRRKIELESLAELSTALEGTASADAISSALLAASTATFEARRVAVLGSREGRVSVLAASAGVRDAEETGAIDALLLEAWRTHEPVLRRDLDPDEDPRLASLLPDADNIAIFPMYGDKEAVGALVVELGRQPSPRLTRRVVTMASQFASHTGLSLQNAWLLETVRRLAATDGLTGLANRRTFEDELARAVARGRSREQPVSLLLLDIDHFKALNDGFGHLVGDEALRDVAQVIGSGLRPDATAARYGGEEFAVLLPDCGAGEASAVAERLRLAVSAVAVSGSVHVTISAGHSTCAGGELDPHTLVEVADAALYAAKRAGRNRVVGGTGVPLGPMPFGVPAARSA